MTPTEHAFLRLVAAWRADTAATSDLREIVEHPAYREVIALGVGVVPLILRELARAPGHWHVALHALTGAQPVAPADAGRLDAIRAAWLAWARAEGLAPAPWTCAASLAEAEARRAAEFAAELPALLDAPDAGAWTTAEPVAARLGPAVAARARDVAAAREYAAERRAMVGKLRP